MANLKNCNLLVVGLSAVTGSAIAATAYGYGIAMTEYGPGPGFWPFILGVSLLAVAVLLLLDTLKHSAEYSAQEILLSTAANLSAYQMMGIVLLYAVLIFITGFYLATALFLICAMYRLGADNFKQILGVTLVFLAFIYILFGMLLHIALPLPIFME
ncbi:MAG: tripartite tricarboxylate transporter TctB family protein [Succinivibrio sp.]|nr:tripartite tricarboxylate transporter TctB family protein [Succinivibrio sp.]